MSNYKEILARSIISKGKKLFTKSYTVKPNNKPNNILGCWVINHKFSGIKQNDKILITGSYDINIWYSYENDTLTDVFKQTINYDETIKMRENGEYENAQITIRCLNDPKCVNAKIKDDEINYQIDLELAIELTGDVKVKILVDDNLDEYNLIQEEENIETLDDINTNYLEK